MSKDNKDIKNIKDIKVFKRIPTYKNSKWSYTDFQTRIGYCEHRIRCGNINLLENCARITSI